MRVNPLLTTFAGSSCCGGLDGGPSCRHVVQGIKAMSRPGDIAGDQLRAVVERIENIEEEIKELTEARKEIYLEAKGNGFDVKILRDVIRVRKQDQKERDEQETLLEVYLQAIESAPSVAKAAKKAA
jgi:uncharacterized protein (UPF0335 family)